jgi:hypothetical protein
MLSLAALVLVASAFPGRRPAAAAAQQARSSWRQEGPIPC